MEYIIVKFDDKNQRATVSLRADEILPQLQEKETEEPESMIFMHILKRVVNRGPLENLI